MAGLLDFINTPQGIGLLSAVAGGMAGARRGTPFNNIGRGAAAGLMGYQSALEQQNAEREKNALRDAMQNAYRAGFGTTTTPGQTMAQVGGNVYANPSDAGFELEQNRAINEMNRMPLDRIQSPSRPAPLGGIDQGNGVQTMPLSYAPLLPRRELSQFPQEDAMNWMVYDNAANPIQPTAEPDVYRHDPLIAYAPEQAPPQLPEQAQTITGKGQTETSYDPRKAAMAMLQSGQPELMQQGFKLLSEVPKTQQPQLVETWDESGRPVKQWMMPGSADGVTVGYGKPELDSRKVGTIDIPRNDGSWQMFQTNPDGTPNMQAPIGSPFRKRATASDVSVSNFPKETFKNERDLRNDFQSLPTTKAFREVQTSYDQIKFALKNPSAANDLAAATKFMKLLDPGSVVRESELGMAMAATGQLDRMSNYYNMLKTGQKLTPSQRADFYKSANGLYAAATSRYNQSAEEFRTMAQDYQLNPDRIAKPAPAEKDSPAAPAVKLSPSEQQELQQLRARFKKK